MPCSLRVLYDVRAHRFRIDYVELHLLQPDVLELFGREVVDRCEADVRRDSRLVAFAAVHYNRYLALFCGKDVEHLLMQLCLHAFVKLIAHVLYYPQAIEVLVAYLRHMKAHPGALDFDEVARIHLQRVPQAFSQLLGKIFPLLGWLHEHLVGEVLSKLLGRLFQYLLALLPGRLLPAIAPLLLIEVLVSEVLLGRYPRLADPYARVLAFGKLRSHVSYSGNYLWI